jgi:hypothetical protein
LCDKIWAHFPLHEKHFVVSTVSSATAEQDVVSAFESIFDVTLVKFTVDETNQYALQETLKCHPFHILL